MKATENFKQTILKYLTERASSDELFAITFKKENKNIDDCVTYILNTVQKSRENGFTDSEIYGMAVHYYDEDNIDIGNPVLNSNIVINHKVELTEEEIKQARERAINEIVQENKNAMRKKPASQPSKQEPKKETFVQGSLF